MKTSQFKIKLFFGLKILFKNNKLRRKIFKNSKNLPKKNFKKFLTQKITDSKNFSKKFQTRKIFQKNSDSKIFGE